MSAKTLKTNALYHNLYFLIFTSTSTCDFINNVFVENLGVHRLQEIATGIV